MNPRITVIGTGYLGATHAAAMAELGFQVTGVDVDSAKIEALSRAEVPFFEPGLAELIERHVHAGTLRFTTDAAAAADFGDVHFLCVGTPQRGDGHAADLTPLTSAIDALAGHLRRACLVVGKSTVPVGTAGWLLDRIRAAAPAGELVEVAWNPEFLREGYGVTDSLRPDRLVFGVRSAQAEALLRRIYARTIDDGTPVLVTDYATAELTKVSANAFLATKISFINAVSELCDAAGADVLRLSEALALDARIGGRFLHPGLGFGGGCLPKDIRALGACAQDLGVGRALGFLGTVDEVNERCRSRVVELARQECGGTLAGQRVAVLGAAFKPGTDDVRDSPALAVATAVSREGAEVRVFDPRANRNAERVRPELGYAPSVVEAATGAHVVLHLTEWPEFDKLDPVRLGAVVAQRRIVDARNALDPQRWQAAGWRYRAPGRPAYGRRPTTTAAAALR